MSLEQIGTYLGAWKSSGVVEKIIARQDWAKENIHDCQQDCDKKSKIPTFLEGDADTIWVACPLLTKDCRRGKLMMKNMNEYALKTIPSAIPNRYAKELYRADETDAILGVKSWNGKGVLYIYGATGTGKSYAAAWSSYYRILQRIEPHWDEEFYWSEHAQDGTEWLTAFDICFDKPSLYAARDAAVLIIDDLGCEVDSPTNRAIINDLISQRYANKKSTIITSNLTPFEMNDRYKERMHERITQTGLFVDAGTCNKRMEV